MKPSCKEGGIVGVNGPLIEGPLIRGPRVGPDRN